MTRTELTAKLEKLETELFCEECKDRGYNFQYAHELKQAITETKQAIKALTC